MTLPSIAIHLHHNAAASVWFEDDILCVIELERLVNLKNASFEFFQPIHSKDYILENLYSYLKCHFGFTEYDKFILGQGFQKVPKSYRNVFPAKQYLVREEHHGSHAYNSFYQSPFDEALIISFDGGSNDGFFHAFHGKKGEDLVHLKSIGIDMGTHYHLIGSFCEEVKNYHCLTAAGKVLGLQSYGKVIEEWKAPIKHFFTEVVPFFVRIEERKLQLSKSLGIDFSEENKLSGQNSYDLCRTAQEVFEEIFFESVGDQIENCKLPLVITGGCALNITLNSKIKDKYNLPVFVAPNSGDCGLTVGMLCKEFKPNKIIDVTYKGMEAIDKFCLMEYVNNRYGRKADLEHMIYDLCNNSILGLFQGRSEHGPRALGNRSIICSPIPPDMKDVLNLKVKHREWYRPFAPVVKLEDVSEYFEWEGESRWMNFCPKVREEYKEKIPAVTHVDGTARVQTVTKEQNPLIYDMLTLFKEKTGIGVLVNTSFNVDRKPILSTYKDAFEVFDNTQLDRLYLDGFYFSK